MSKRQAVSKRIEKEKARVASMYWRNGLNPASGFTFDSTRAVWMFLTAMPMLFAAVFAASLMVAFTIWPIAFFIAAIFGFLSFWWWWSSSVWFAHRGWGEAIMQIEHKKRKVTHYAGKDS